MKIDFHTHGKLSKKLPFSSEYTKLLFKEAKNSGLDALCLTEHFNTIGFKEFYSYIASNYEKVDDCYSVEGVKVFPGMEVDIAEGGHILVLGYMDSILNMNGALEPYKQKDKFIPFKDLIKLAEYYKVMLGAAHSYREGSNIPELDTELLKQLSFVDLNGKDYADKNERAREEISGFANKINLPVVAGSDTHQCFQYGCIWNNFEKDCTKIEELKEALDNRMYKIEISENIAFKVKTAIVLKKALLLIHSLKGDYVAVLKNE